MDVHEVMWMLTRSSECGSSCVCGCSSRVWMFITTWMFMKLCGCSLMLTFWMKVYGCSIYGCSFMDAHQVMWMFFTDTTHVITAPEEPESLKRVSCTRTTSRKRPQKYPLVGAMTFANEREANMYLRCGKHKSEASPCVNRASLVDDYPIVYEEWQINKVEQQIKWFRCRRSGNCRRKNGIRTVDILGRLRKMKTNNCKHKS